MHKTVIPYGYCHCGCGQKTATIPASNRRRGLVRGEPMRFIQHHQRLLTDPGYTEDLLTGCWLWRGTIGTAGYGIICRYNRFGVRCDTAHRFYYEQHREAIPADMQIDHLCKNKGCVNPNHMEVVTRTVNMRRRDFCKLDMDKAREIRNKYASGTTKAQLAREYEVAFMSITYIVRNETWKENKE